MIELFQVQVDTWRMTTGERAALAGILAELRPDVALEIGSAEGGSLGCIAAHAGEVHSFDLSPPSAEMQDPPNVTRHIGDSHQLLPQVLRELESRNANVGFALVDGDHTASGARRDVEDLLASPAVSKTVILAHDTVNEEVRRGLEAVPYDAYPKVKAVDLDFLPGFIIKVPQAEREQWYGMFHNELWGGFGLILVDHEEGFGDGQQFLSNIAYSPAAILSDYRARLIGADQRATQHSGSSHARTGLASTKSWLLPPPVKRLREHLREIRRVAGETQIQVTALTAALQRVEARLDALAQQVQAASASHTGDSRTGS